MANPLLTKYDLDKFAWKAMKDGGRMRLLAGQERTFFTLNHFRHGHSNLFSATYIALSSPTAHTKLQALGHDAWVWLRYHIPTLAVHLHADDVYAPTFSYHTSTAAEITQWANRTFRFSTQDKVDLDALRVKLGPEEIPSKEGDLTWLHLLAGPPDANGNVQKFGLLLHTHHAVFDAAGTRGVINRYLQHLAFTLGGVETEPLRWGDELGNLIPAAFTVISDNEPRPTPSGSPEIPSFDHPYYASLGTVFKVLAESQKDLYGFNPRTADPGKLSAMRLEVAFTREESLAIIKALKNKSPDRYYTVTHLAHSALAMMVMFFNPPTSETASHTLNCWGLTDPRYLLREPYSSRDGYPASAIAAPLLRAPVAAFLSETGELLQLDKNTLLRAMEIMREVYAAEKAKPAVFSWMAQATEIFGARVTEAAIANRSPANQNAHITSDGVAEKYVNRAFADSSSKLAMSVEKIFTSVNYSEPAPFFRTWSWRDIIYLSADFNVNVLSVEEANSYLMKWKEFMLLSTGI